MVYLSLFGVICFSISSEVGIYAPLTHTHSYYGSIDYYLRCNLLRSSEHSCIQIHINGYSLGGGQFGVQFLPQAHTDLLTTGVIETPILQSEDDRSSSASEVVYANNRCSSS